MAVPAQEGLNRGQIDFLPLNVARRCGIGQDIAVRGDNVQLNARIKGHQPIEQRQAPFGRPCPARPESVHAERSAVPARRNSRCTIALPYCVLV